MYSLKEEVGQIIKRVWLYLFKGVDKGGAAILAAILAAKILFKNARNIIYCLTPPMPSSTV